MIMHAKLSHMFMHGSCLWSAHIHGIIYHLRGLQELTFLEFFAGEGNCWRLVRADSAAAIGLDLTYDNKPWPKDEHRSPFDILSPSGFTYHT